MSEVNLKPCPCCGGEAVMQQTGRDKLKIQCKRCALKREQRCLRYSLEWLEQRMAESWNTRHAPEGWQCVPTEATEEMEDATDGLDIYWGYEAKGPGSPRDAYRAMLKAAPSPGQEV